MRVIINPYAKRLLDGRTSPKDYPYWNELISMAGNSYQFTQIGLPGEPIINGVTSAYLGVNLCRIKEVTMEHDMFVAIDSFLPHLCHLYNIRGVVIFGLSDPNLFGYSENINLLKDRKYLRVRQFACWGEEQYNPDVFISPEKVVEAMDRLRGELSEKANR